MQFSSDDVARILSCALSQVFDELSLQQTVEGTALLPAGDSTYLIDIVLRDRSTKKLRGVSVTIPPTEGKRIIPPDRNKKFEVLTISRDYLQSIGMHSEQVARLTDEDMARIAEILVAHYFESEFDEEARFTARLVLAERTKHEG